MTDCECEREPPLEFDSDVPLPVDTLFDVLSDWRRRRVLSRLDACDDSVPIADLAEMLAADSNSSVGSTRTHVSLHHSILPRLAAEELITYERDAERASLTELGRRLRPYVEYTRKLDANVED